MKRLCEQVINGDVKAFSELKQLAGSGNAEAQYQLSIVYSDKKSPYEDESLWMYWLKKSAEYGCYEAIKKLWFLPLDIKEKYNIVESPNFIWERYEEEKRKKSDVKPGGIWSIRGRIDRSTYFIYMLIYTIVLDCLVWVVGRLPMETVDYGYYTTTEPSSMASVLIAVIVAVMLYLFFALASKRAHDCGDSCLYVLIPFWGIVLLFKGSEPQTNEYGPVPE